MSVKEIYHSFNLIFPLGVTLPLSRSRQRQKSEKSLLWWKINRALNEQQKSIDFCTIKSLSTQFKPSVYTQQTSYTILDQSFAHQYDLVLVLVSNQQTTSQGVMASLCLVRCTNIHYFFHSLDLVQKIRKLLSNLMITLKIDLGFTFSFKKS